MKEKLRMVRICLVAGLVFAGVLFSGHKSAPILDVDPVDPAEKWADSILSSMSLEEKVGQLFMIATFSNKDEQHYQYIESMVRNQHLGGLIFMQGNPASQVELVNRYQATAKVPLMISQDAEWGVAMRLKGTRAYPKNMTLGAIQNDSLLYALGKQMARELRAVGVNVNFAPSVDVNNNPRNPVINYRSFGENKYNVSRKGIMLMKGMQDHKVMACAKHFPGHGDTDTDSHHDLPLIHHNRDRLDTLELYPFMKMMEAGVQSLMVAHLYVPALDSTPNQASTLSPNIVHQLIRENMGYDGLLFTDALNMQGVAKFYPAGEVSLRAFLAGNDVLLFPGDVPRSARLIRHAVERGSITKADLDQRVKRILRAKYSVGLNQREKISTDELPAVFNDLEANILRRRLYQAAVTIPKNDAGLLPLKKLDQRKIAYVQIGGGSGNQMDQSLQKYADVDAFYLRKGFTSGEKAKLFRDIEGYNTVILGLFGMNNRPSQKFGVRASAIQLSKELSEKVPNSILAMFGNPYALKDFGSEDAVVLGYEAVREAEQAVAAAIFGGKAVSGRLPVTASKQFREGMGAQIRLPIRFGFSLPEEQGMDSKVLAGIDRIADRYIDRMATPGCAILVMRGNDIVYEKGFGRTMYGPSGENINPWQHTYDLASVTKVVGTTLCTMYLVERGRLKLDAPISTYLPELKGSNKARLTIRRLLQHNAGLPGWIPFYEKTFIDEKQKMLDPKVYSFQKTGRHTQEIAPNLYVDPKVYDQVWQQIVEVEVRDTERVRYSDIGMIIMARIIERVSGQKMDVLLDKLFYQSMGMDHTYFRPNEKGLAGDCPPTELDTVWRQGVVQGFVHDPAASLLGGVSGHAGLFSNVYDLAKVLMMLKNGGVYGQKRYLRPTTIHHFTRKQIAHSRKGLGWDKPEGSDNKRRRNPASDFASLKTFGHTGFTGTCVWVDPQYDLIYVFLANRTFPYASNRQLARESVRIKVMDKIYESIYAFGRT
ncbi:MAG: glycoside hydrolase family 3 N-terminal domain-containing protein [Bacteroidota bacterium]